MIGRLGMHRPTPDKRARGGPDAGTRRGEHAEPTTSRIAAPPRPRVAPAPRASVRASERPRPAALEWRDASLPVLGRLRAAAWLPTLLLAASLVALVYLLQTSGVASTGYDIQRLQSDRAAWQLRNEQLRLELAKRRSLTWVEAEATGRLGMQRPDAGTTTYLKTTR
jgi:hypothetical protein